MVLKKDYFDGLSGKNIQLKVDEKYRYSLSIQHTGCHISALAFNKNLNNYWKKPVEKDSLGSFDFDQKAIETSIITPNKSIDRYRIGKSLRKRRL